MLSVLNDSLGALTEVDLVFVIDEFGESGFHFRKLFEASLVIGLDFIDEGVVCFDDSRDYPGHEFDDRLKLNSCLVVFLHNLIFLLAN